MEKIININFHGRVILIEETAYENLKLYIDALRHHFAGEESSDEIMNDIENRIAELLSDRLKRGVHCITNSDINVVIDSIGRLEDIEAAEAEETTNTKSATHGTPPLKERFSRDADNKVIAGVCSGIANRMGIDTVIVRVVFVLFFGICFGLYLLLWLIVPAQSQQYNITRRLYRNPSDKVIAGVCGGLATYFRVDSWVPRLIFVLPLILGVISGSIHWFWSPGPRILTGSLGSTLFIIYVILWISLPYASSSTEILELRGEKIDMNSIKAATQARSGQPQAVRRRNGLGYVIGLIFKAFFLFIAGSVALGLFGALIGLFFAGVVAFPFTDFFIGGWGQYSLAWAGVILFLCIPLLALITWLVRRLIGVRTRRHYLGYIFAGLWIIGVFSVILLVGVVIGNFRSKSYVEDSFPVQQPSGGKLYINVSDAHNRSYTHRYRWFTDIDDEDMPFRIVNKDSLLLNTVKVNVAQSPDSLYHLNLIRVSRGNTSEDARDLATHITFTINQQDSMITLPRWFAVSSKDKFRNQQVMVVVEVPAGKKIQFNRSIHDYDWFTIDVNGRRNMHIESNWSNTYDYKSNREYTMMPNGLMNAQDSTMVKNYYNDEDDNDDDE